MNTNVKIEINAHVSLKPGERNVAFLDYNCFGDYIPMCLVIASYISIAAESTDMDPLQMADTIRMFIEANKGRIKWKSRSN